MLCSSASLRQLLPEQVESAIVPGEPRSEGQRGAVRGWKACVPSFGIARRRMNSCTKFYLACVAGAARGGVVGGDVDFLRRELTRKVKRLRMSVSVCV